MQNPNISSGGVAIFVKNNKYIAEVNLITYLETVAIKVFSPRKMTISCVYLPPNQNDDKQELEALIDKLLSPYIIAGTNNAHNIIWSSNRTDKRGKITESIIEDRDLVLLNDGSDTQFCSQSGNFSCITLFSSNHLPIKITSYTQNKEEYHRIYARWKTENVNWDL